MLQAKGHVRRLGATERLVGAEPRNYLEGVGVDGPPAQKPVTIGSLQLSSSLGSFAQPKEIYS